MALTEKEILETLELQLPEDATAEDFQNAFNEKFLPVKMAANDSRVTGRIYGSLGRKYKQMLQPVVGEWDEAETDWNNPDKVIEAAIARITKKATDYEAAVAELKEAKKGGSSKEIQDAIAKLEQTEKALNDERQMREKIAQEFDGFKTSIAQEKRQSKLKNLYDSAFSKVELSDDFKNNIILQEGFNAYLSKKYKVDLNEEENDIVPFNPETNERIKTPAGTDYEKWENIIKREVETLGYLKKNSGQSDFGSRQQQSSQQQQQQQSNTYTRKMAPEVNTSVIKG